jgi:hypothetical protein
MPCARDATDLRHHQPAITLKRRAIDALRAIFPAEDAINAAEIVLENLGEPDRDMLDAGRAELDLALGKPADRQHGAAYRRDLCAVIWRAMLDRVQG